MTANRQHPPRKMGMWMTTALVVGNVIGTGVILLPASLATFGWNSVLGWGVSLLGALSLASVFANLSRELPAAGGAYGFMRMSLGEGPAFLGAWGYWVSVWTSNAALAIGGVSYLSRLVPAIDHSPTLALGCTVGIIWLLTWVNAQGIRSAGQVQVVTTIVKLLPFGAVLMLAAWRVSHDGPQVIAPFQQSQLTWSQVTAAATLTFFSLVGFESAAVPADSVENPQVTVPRATMVGTVLTGLISLLVCSSIVLMLPPALLAESKAPFSDFMAGSWSGAGAAVAGCAVISAFGALNGWVFLTGELPAAMAEAGRLPSWWGQRNAAGAPVRALVIGAVLATGLVLLSALDATGSAFTFAILLSTAMSLVMYLICSLGALRLMYTEAIPRRASLFATSVLGTLFSVWAFWGSGLQALGWGAVLLAAGYPLYRLTLRERARLEPAAE